MVQKALIKDAAKLLQRSFRFSEPLVVHGRQFSTHTPGADTRFGSACSPTLPLQYLYRRQTFELKQSWSTARKKLSM